MRLIWALLLLVCGAAGSSLLVIRHQPLRDHLSWLANSASISPLPAVYSGADSVEDYRTRLVVTWESAPRHILAKRPLTARELDRTFPNLLRRRALVSALQAWEVQIETDAQRTLISRLLCARESEARRVSVAAWDARSHGKGLIREEEMLCLVH